jgi:hypothetical protein
VLGQPALPTDGSAGRFALPILKNNFAERGLFPAH